MVAAWISAETGVGPAIASGSQTNSGICADLPHAPMNNSSAAAVQTPTGSPPTFARIPWISSVPVADRRSSMPSMKPRSPTRLVMNAFLPASAQLMRVSSSNIRS